SVLVDHFRAVADESPIPVLLYSVPIFTSVTIETPTIVELAQHPNIIGMKDSTGNYNALVDILRQVPGSFKVLYGAAPAVYGSLCMGAVGGTLAVANMAPDLCSSIYTAYASGNHNAARGFQMKLATLLEKTVTKYGIGGIKAALDLRGAYGGRPRRPLPYPDSNGRFEIEQALREAELL